MTDWWTHYLDGKIIVRDDTPQAIISTMEDWFDGKSSAMRRFARREPVPPCTLLREIDKCLSGNTLDEEVARLKALQIWALREAELANTAKNLREARQAFNAAVEGVGLDPYYASRIAGEI